MRQSRGKIGKEKCLLEHPKWSVFKAFWDTRGAKMAQSGLISLVCATQMAHNHSRKGTLLCHIWSKNVPFSKLAKARYHGLKTGKKTLV